MAPLRTTVLLVGACLAGAIIDARVGQPGLTGEGLAGDEGVARCPRETKAMPFSRHPTRQFNGSFVFSGFDGDMQAVYQRMGVPWELRMLAKKFNYGIDFSGEDVDHKGNYIKITSLVNLNNRFYVLGAADYIVGVGKATPFGYSICGNWIANGTALLVRCQEGKDAKYGGKVIFPSIRRFWNEDNKSQTVEATILDIVIPMTMSPRTKRNRGGTIEGPVPPGLQPATRGDDKKPVPPVDANSDAIAAMTKEEAVTFAGMVSMGLLPPFMPMKLIDFAELTN